MGIVQWSMWAKRIPLIGTTHRDRPGAQRDCESKCGAARGNKRTAMSIFRVKTTEARVGVVGLYSAGKTVLLTSLINHLQDHDPDRFPLGKPGTQIRRFTVKESDREWSAFNYAGHRDALVN